MGRRLRHVLSLSSQSIFIILFLFTSFSPANGKTNLTRPSFTTINRDLYHNSDSLMEEISALVHRHPHKLYMETIGSQNKGYRAEMTVVTYCLNRTEIDDKLKYRVLLSFGQHGRELITSELALKILSILSEEQFLPNMDPIILKGTLERLVIKEKYLVVFDELGKLLEMTAVVPMENLNGRKLVEEGDLCERRNGRGVDLNRNWSVDWGKKEKALFMPYDHKNTTPDGSPSQRIRLMLEKLNHLHCKDNCVVGSGGGSVGLVLLTYPAESRNMRNGKEGWKVDIIWYLAHGTATDYMYDIARVPMAFTFEIYGDRTASSKDCFKMFNPVDHTTFNLVLNEWSAAFLAMFNMSTHQLDELRSKTSDSDKLVSIEDYMNGFLMETTSRYGKKKEVLELGMQEIRTYFRLFVLSSVLLMFMFCSRISKSSRPIVSGMPL
ncbi:hypothetical protein RHGRI_022175 [Rhododendron griersonianum]|uniref:Peptidase M14 domain-containing protein n=1 Tax=Rhododendron griersonianum TaxID=479676 RepID=A0AAV6JPA7_9ERIC|nr:hypothetical protein RHGRI_022175 [Rhododendron griersonianum]